MEGAHRRREARIERLNGSPLNAGAGFLGVPIVALLSRPSCTCVPRVQSRREVEHVVRAYRGAVGIDEADILAPGAQEFSVPIIDDDGMGAAREDVDIILTIDADGSSIAVRVAGRKFAPVLDYPIPVLSFSENDGRRGSARGGRVSHRCDSAERSSCYRCGEACERLSTGHRAVSRPLEKPSSPQITG